MSGTSRALVIVFVTLAAMAGCGRATSRVVRLHLERGAVVTTGNVRAVSGGDGPEQFDEPIASDFTVTITAPGRATVRAQLSTVVADDPHRYWGSLIQQNAWNRSIVNPRGHIVAGHTDLPAHPMFFASPLERLVGSHGPFVLPATGQGVILVAPTWIPLVRIDGNVVTLQPAPDVDGFGRGWTLPFVQPLAPGPHLVEVGAGEDGLTRTVSVQPGVYEYLCAKDLWSSRRTGSMYN